MNPKWNVLHVLKSMYIACYSISLWNWGICSEISLSTGSFLFFFVVLNCLLSALVSLQCCSDGNLLFLVQTHLENAGWATAVYCYIRSNTCQAVLSMCWINTMKQCYNWLLKGQTSRLKVVFKSVLIS